MRCEHDTATMPLVGVPVLPAERLQLELPDVPAAPVKAPRYTQAVRIERMGYRGPKERPRCETCKHCELSDVAHLIRCRLGDFPVMRGGFCNDYAE
jgi:hypothetical protein